MAQLIWQSTRLTKKLQKSGCSNLLIGFESLNEDTLKSMGKSWAV